jgi:hypothetical protein
MEASTPRTPTTKANVGLFAVLFLLALLGGDYYFLTHPLPVEAASAVASAAPVPEGPRKKRGKKSRVAAAPPVAADSTNRLAKGMAGAGARLQQKAEASLSKMYVPFGKYFRWLLIIASVIVAASMKLPPPRPGMPKRKKPEKKVVRSVVGACAVVMAAGSYVLLTIAEHAIPFIETGYPAAAGAVLLGGIIAGIVLASQKRQVSGLTTELKEKKTPLGLTFKTEGGGYINIPNPFRGTLVLGGAGAGKTYSIGEPMLEQFAEMGFAGLVYDFKFPVLAEVMQKAIVLAEAKAKALKKPFKPMKYHVINFRDMERTEKVNPLRAENLTEMAYALDYSKAILNNLNPDSIKDRGFFNVSAEAYLTSIIWFYRCNYPNFCTIPHVVNTILYKDFRHVLAMIETHPESADQARSLITALDQRAEKQIAGVVASLQTAVNRINTPELVWVLTPDEAHGEGFGLDLNNPENPALLCIGNDPTLKETFSPIIACIVTVCMKLMNQQAKAPSFMFLDEAATIYVPNLEELPATARSNKVALVYMTQDLAQMNDAYGQDKTRVMVANLNNWLFGKVNNVETARLISDMVGKEDREMVSVSVGRSSSGGMSGGGSSSNQSVSFQERSVLRVQDLVGLEQGEFAGQTVETETNFFQGKILRTEGPGKYPLQPMTTFSFGTAQAEIPRQVPGYDGSSGEKMSRLQQRELARRQPVARPALDAEKSIIRRNFELVREDVAAIIESFDNRFWSPSERAAAMAERYQAEDEKITRAAFSPRHTPDDDDQE